MKSRKFLFTIGVLVLTLTMVSGVLAQDASPGTMNTNVKVMGLASSGTTNMVAEYWVGTGGATPAVSISRSVEGYGSYNFRAADTGLTGPWAGSVVVSSDKPVAATGELVLAGGSAADGKHVNYYEAFSEPAATLYLPYAVLAPHPTTGDLVHYSQFYVQNTSPSQVSVQIRYIDRAGGSVTSNTTIPANGQGRYDLSVPGPGVPDLTTTGYFSTNGNWGGGIVISTTDPVLTAALVHQWREYSGAYSAIASGDSKIYLTNIDRRIFDCTAAGSTCGNNSFAGVSSIVVQNFDLVSSVNFTVTFYSKTTGGSRSFTDSLGPGAAKGYNTRQGADTPGGAAFYEDLTFWDDISTAANPQLGSAADGTQLWVGSAVVQGPPGSQLAASVVNQQIRTNLASMYVSAADSDAAQTIVFPIAYRYTSGTQHWNLGRVMNVSAGTADVDVYFYNANGTLQTSWLNRSVTQYSIVDEFNLVGAQFNAVGTAWSGSIVVVADRPVVATTDVLWQPERYGAYNGVPVP